MLSTSRTFDIPVTLGLIDSLVGEKKKIAIGQYLSQNKKIPLSEMAGILNVSITYLTVIRSLHAQRIAKEKAEAKKANAPKIVTEKRHVGRAPMKANQDLSAYEKRLRKVQMIIDSLLQQDICHCGTLATYAQTNVLFVKRYINNHHPNKKTLAHRQFSHLACIALKKLKNGETEKQVARDTGLHPLAIANINKYRVSNFVSKILPEINMMQVAGDNVQVIGQRYGIPGSVITSYYKRLRRASTT